MELQIRGVSKAYSNGVQALKDVTLTAPVGTLFATALAQGASSDLMDRIGGRRSKCTGR